MVFGKNGIDEVLSPPALLQETGSGMRLRLTREIAVKPDLGRDVMLDRRYSNNSIRV
jgi:hypothetical protein